MKKNSQIFIRIETELKERLKAQADEEGILLTELCRRRLRNNDKLAKIEGMLEEIQKFLYREN